MTTYDAILIAYAFLGCVYWLWMAFGAIRIVRGVPVLAQDEPPEPVVWPKLTLVIPACNEAETLQHAIRTVLQQDYPNLEVVLIDDRSTDGTGAIVDCVAAGELRLRPLHITELPDGWLGKVHALARGVEHADGEWLLFTDADVHLAPGTLRRAVAYAEHHRLDHLAAMPDMWPSSLWLDATVAAFLRVFAIGIRCWAVGDPESDAYAGVGAFNLVRRAAFDRTEGFQWLRLEVADDMGLGMMLKRAGGRTAVVNATGCIGLHWYRTFAEAARGSDKAYAAVGHFSLLRMLCAAATIVGLEWAPLVAVLPLGVPALLPVGLLMIAAAVFSIVLLRRWYHARVLPGLLSPLAALVAAGLLVRAGWRGFRRGGIEWRGTFYPTAMLRSGCRVRFP